MEGGVALRNGIAFAQALFGKGMREDKFLLSSGCNARVPRSPEDVIAFASLLGFTTRQAYASLTSAAASAIAEGERRQAPAGGVTLV